MFMEVGLAEAVMGRKPILLDITPDICYVIGLEMTTDGITIALCDGKIAPRHVCHLPVDPEADAQSTTAQVVEGIETCIRESEVSRDKILGIGIAAPGPLDADAGVLINPPNFPRWKDVPLASMLRNATGLPVCCDRESNAAVLGEYYYGCAQGYKTVFFMTLFKSSIGGGIISGGNVIHGFRDGAGEIGHILVDINGPKCYCGNYGCLESLVKGDALVQEAQTRIRTMNNLNLPLPCDVEALTLRDIFTLSDSGVDPFEDIVDRAAQYIAIAIGNIVTLISPELIVLGGTLPYYSEAFVDKVRAYVRNRAYPRHSREIKIMTSQLGEAGCARGAAAMAMDAFQPQLFSENVDLCFARYRMR